VINLAYVAGKMAAMNFSNVLHYI